MPYNDDFDNTHRRSSSGNGAFDDYDMNLGMAGVPRQARQPRRQRRDNEVRTVHNEQQPRETRRPRAAAQSTSRQPAPQQRRRTQSEPRYGFVDFVTDYRTRLALGILLCVVGLLMAGVSISFFTNGQLDQDIIHNRSTQEIMAAGDTVNNLGGIAGSKLAEFLMVRTLGLGSFVIAIYIFILGLVAIGVLKVNFFTLTFKSLYSAVAVSIIAGLLTYHSSGFFHLGGNHGYYINDLFYRVGDGWVAFAVSIVLLGGLVAIYLKPLGTFFRAIGRGIRSISHSIPRMGKDPAQQSSHPSPVLVDSGHVNHEALDEVLDEIAVPESTRQEEEEIEPEDQLSDSAEEFQDTPASIEDLDTPDERRSGGPEVGYEMYGRNEDVLNNDLPQKSGLTTLPESGNGPELVITNAATPGDEELPVADFEDETGHKASAFIDGGHKGPDEPFDHRAELSNFKFPGTDILIERPAAVEINEEEQQANKDLIVNALRSYNIEISRIEATIGPTVTLYEIVPAEGVRIAKIKSLEDDIAMNLAALGIRIIAPIPGKGTIGIEVPNRKPQIVGIRTVLESEAFQKAKQRMALPMALGATISNDIFIADLTKMPHLLVAGATGQGKSVGLNAIITSLLYAKHPSELKFVLIDPKRVEFSVYKALENHYMAKHPSEDNPIITDPAKAVSTLQSLCEEMEERYNLLSDAGVRTLEKYNERFCQRRLNPQKGHRYLPYIVMIVDEFADLTMVAGKDVSLPIARIAQKARAVGMHMILATQRPSTDVITGMIKANFPGRIAFRVQQMVDSRTIIDAPGANRLIGRGDMLFSNSGTMERVQCALVETEEIEDIVNHISTQLGYNEAYPLPDPPAQESSEFSAGGGSVDISTRDKTFMDCARFAGTLSEISVSLFQRKFSIGYNRASRIMDDLEALGIVSAQNGQSRRQVLKSLAEVEEILAQT